MKIVLMIDLAVHNYISKLVAVQDKTVKRTTQNFMKTIEFFKSHLRKEYKKKLRQMRLLYAIKSINIKRRENAHTNKETIFANNRTISAE